MTSSECVKVLVLQNHHSRISMTWGHRRTAKRSFSEEPVPWWCTWSQRSSTRPTTHCDEHLQVKLFGEKGRLCDILQSSKSLGQKNIWWRGGKGCMTCFLFLLLFSFGMEAIMLGSRNERTGKWVGLGSVIWNFQRINKIIILKKRKFRLLRPSHFGAYTGHMFKVCINIFIFSKCTYISTQVYVKV